MKAVFYPFRPTFHHVKDGRGPRVVFLDGRIIRYVIYADLERGSLRYFVQPAKFYKRHARLITRKLRALRSIEIVYITEEFQQDQAAFEAWIEFQHAKRTVH